MTRIYLSPPEVSGLDRQFLLDALDSSWIAPAGPDIDAFEAEVARACGRTYGVALSSGTAALHLALLEAGVCPGDVVFVSTFTFAASANAVRYVGARPVFIDALADTWQMSPSLLADGIRAMQRAGVRPAAVIPVDLYGQCADYDVLLAICCDAGIPLIEDAAEALGATYAGRPAGSFGLAAAVSFNGNKIITTSGGGMLVTDDERFAQRCRHLSTQAREPAAHYEHTEVGFNYRLSNLLAAFGRGQLRDLPRRVAQRRRINERYRAGLDGLAGVEFMPESTYGASNHWLTCITVDPDVSRVSREGLRIALEKADIESRPTWKPMHLQPVYADETGFVDGTSERLFRTGLCLPSGSSLTTDEQDRVIELLRAQIESS